MKKYLIVVILLLIVPITVLANGQDTCPQDNGWTKIDSDDLSQYPVSGATAYCFKAGSDKSKGCEGGLFNSIPEGGFNQPYCGLSHWSYYVPSPTPTFTASPTPTASPTSSPSSTASPTFSPTVSPTTKPTVSPTSSPTDKPTDRPSTPQPTENSKYEEIRKIEGPVFGPQK